MITNIIQRLGTVRTALLAGVGLSLLVSMSLKAQSPEGSPPSSLPENGPGPAPAPAPASTGEASTERVVVTGSYIPTAEEVTASPLDTITTQEINRSGSTDVLTVLQKRNPDFVGAGNLGNTNANIASGATLGGSVISIRGLPTLVLYEGRRIADAAAVSVGGIQFSDVSLFPTALISRIDVLKDGASALYGSDAVGGVVNIFLKQDFTGVELGARYGFSVEPGVAERRAFVVAGVGNDTTHVTVGFQYLEEDPLFERERAYSRIPGGLTTTFGGVGRDNQGGGTKFYLLNGVDPLQPFGRPALNSPFDAGVVPGSIAPPPPGSGAANPGQYAQLPGVYNQVPQSTITSYDLSQVPSSTLDISNTNAYASFTHQIFGKQLELFGDFLYTRNHSESFLNAQPLNNGTGVVIPPGRVGTNDDVTSPAYVPGVTNTIFNPFQLQIDSNTLTGNNRLFVNNRYQTNPRTFTQDNNFYRFLGGLRSEFAKGWTAEVATYYSKYATDFVNAGLVNATQLNAAIAGTATDNNGNPIPAFDFFAINPVGTNPGQVTPGQFSTFFGNNIRKLSSYQEVFDGKINGFPFELPGGAVGIALGAEYRVEGFKVQDSPEIFVGSVPIQQINASRSIYSFYGELSVPIIGSSQKIPWVYSLELDLAGRYDHYEGVSEDAKVPKVSLRYQPIKDLTLRATYSNSFVAPNLFQLNGPTALGFSPSISFKDPVTGAPVVQDQAQVSAGTNPNLVPSKAESYTAGLVYSPSFLPGLTVSIDYFRTLQQEIVAVLGGAVILNSVNERGPNSPYANLVAFNNFPGQTGAVPVTAAGQLFGNLASVFYIDNLVNIGALRVEGFDSSLRYNIDLQRFGQLELGVASVVFTQVEAKTTPLTNYFNISNLDGAEGAAAFTDYKLTFLAEYRFAGFTLPETQTTFLS